MLGAPAAPPASAIDVAKTAGRRWSCRAKSERLRKADPTAPATGAHRPHGRRARPPLRPTGPPGDRRRVHDVGCRRTITEQQPRAQKGPAHLIRGSTLGARCIERLGADRAVVAAWPSTRALRGTGYPGGLKGDDIRPKRGGPRDAAESAAIAGAPGRTPRGTRWSPSWRRAAARSSAAERKRRSRMNN